MQNFAVEISKNLHLASAKFQIFDFKSKKKSAKIFDFPSRNFEIFDFKSKILAKIFDLPSRICLIFGFKSKMFGKNFRLSENCHLKSTGKLCKLENFRLYKSEISDLKSEFFFPTWESEKKRPASSV